MPLVLIYAGNVAFGVLMLLVSEYMLRRSDTMAPKLTVRWERETFGDRYLIWRFRFVLRSFWVGGIIMIVASVIALGFEVL